MKTRISSKVCLNLLAVASGMALAAPHAQAALVFSHDFDDGTSGVVDAIADLGAPSVGSLAFENGATPTYGFVSTGTGKAFTTGNDSNTRNTITPAGTSLNTPFEASPGTSFKGVAPDNRLYANFAAADITVGNSAVVNFDYGSYGTQNSGAFKALVVRGLSAGGDEVFEAWFGMGSGGVTRFVYAREAGDTTYTRTTTSAGTPEGTLVYSGIGGYNSTNTASPPGSLNTMTITILNGQVTYGSSGGNPGGTLTFGQNSSATDLAQLEFTSVNFNQGGNSGYWLDNVTVEAVPEPTGLLLGGIGLLGILRRRR